MDIDGGSIMVGGIGLVAVALIFNILAIATGDVIYWAAWATSIGFAGLAFVVGWFR